MEDEKQRRYSGQHLPLSGGSRCAGSLSTPALVAGLRIASSGSSASGSPVRCLSIPAGARGSSLGGESTSRCAGDFPLAGEAIGNGLGTDLVGARYLGLFDASAVLVLLGFGVAVEVQIGHDVPLGLTGSEGAAEAENLTGKHPPDETNGVTALVVSGDGNINVLGGRVTVAKSLCIVNTTKRQRGGRRASTYNDGDVDVGSLLDGLGISARVGDDDQARLLERAGDVVGEVTGGEATSDGNGASVGGELENGTLSVGTGGNDTDCSHVS
jgi:hypothetical protein